MSTKNAILFAIGIGIGAATMDLILTNNKPVVTAKPSEHQANNPAQYYPIPIKQRIDSCKKWESCKQIARALVYEARSESAVAQAAIAHVILNRVKHEDFPKSVPAVIKQDKQFSFYGKEWKQRKPRQVDWENAYSIAYDVMKGNVEDPSFGSTFYARKEVAPRRLGDVEYVVSIDSHKFYKERSR